VEEKPAQELDAGKRHAALATVGSAIPVAEGDRIIVDGEQTPIADSDAMGVAGQVLQYQLG